MALTHKRSTNRAAGFSLLELLVVVTVIGILLAITARTYINTRDRGRQSATLADMRTLSTAIETYMIDYSYPPAWSGDFTKVVEVLKPYANNAQIRSTDHWGHRFDFERNGLGDYTIHSYGKDGIDGPELTTSTRFDFTRDIVLSNGIFRSWPGKVVKDGQATASPVSGSIR